MYYISIYDTYMPHLSKGRLTQKLQAELLQTFKTVLRRIKTDSEAEFFLSSLLSETERMMLAKRLAIVVLLEENVPETTIAEILRVTRETVNRIGLLSQIKGEGYKIALRKLNEEKALSTFKKFLLSLARYSIRAARGYVKPSILD